MNNEQKNQKFLENLAHILANWAGNSWIFLIALAFTLFWIVAGPVFHFSTKWQLIMGNVSSVTTFIMVFVLQRAQSKSTAAMQIKLNEIIAALAGANNHLIGLEDASEDIIESFQSDHKEVAQHIHSKEEISTSAISIIEEKMIMNSGEL